MSLIGINYVIFQLLQDIGYRHCKTVLSGWSKSKVLSQLLSQDGDIRKSRLEHHQERNQV